MSRWSKDNQYLMANILLSYQSIKVYSSSVKSNALSKSNLKVRILLLFKQTKNGPGKLVIPFFIFHDRKIKQAGSFSILPKS